MWVIPLSSMATMSRSVWSRRSVLVFSCACAGWVRMTAGGGGRKGGGGFGEDGLEHLGDSLSFEGWGKGGILSQLFWLCDDGGGFLVGLYVRYRGGFRIFSSRAMAFVLDVWILRARDENSGMTMVGAKRRFAGGIDRDRGQRAEDRGERQGLRFAKQRLARRIPKRGLGTTGFWRGLGTTGTLNSAQGCVNTRLLQRPP